MLLILLIDLLYRSAERKHAEDQERRGRSHTRLKSHRRAAFRLLQLSGRKEIDTMNKHLLNRRQFSARCAASGLAFPALSAMLAVQARAQVPGAGAGSKPAARTVTVKLPDG